MATPALSHSAKLYMERYSPSSQTTNRLPAMRVGIDQNLVHQIPLKPPFPIPEVLQKEGNHPPDAGLTLPWPFGREEIL
jgi:hypothetical protein